MRAKIQKVVAILAGVIVITFAVYLMFPPLTVLSTGNAGTGAATPITSSHACKTDMIYVTEETREIHEKEEYPFVVDDNCANLQKHLVDAVQNDDVKAATELIAAGANPQTADWSMFEPSLPLQVAVYKSPAIVKLLLDNGADVNKERCCCAACSSPLTTVIQENKTETVQLLLEHGANVEYRPRFTDGEPYSPFELAMRSGNPDIISLVSDACEQTLMCRIKSRTRRILRSIGR
jgi:ankyrin repeat protein